MNGSIYDIPITRIDGTETSLAEYKGKTLLIVNTASKCGLTPQYEGLNELYRKYKGRGLVVLGFPCNQFMNQEPGSEKQIAEFCKLNYDVHFPMFAKVIVNGPDAHPLYQVLKSEARGFLGVKTVAWNFTKFLVSPEGRVLKRFKPTRTPSKLEAEIAAALPQGALLT
jgi:glutathione peroxidase